MDLAIFIQLIFLCVVNIAFTFSGIILNALVIASLWMSSQLRKKHCNFMIMLMSHVDFLTVIICHPVFLIYIVFWLTTNDDLLRKTEVYAHFASAFFGFSLLTVFLMNFERYLSVYYPIFQRTSVTRSRLLVIFATLLLLHAALMIISTNDRVIRVQVALMIFTGIVFPPLMYINYKLFKISRRMRRDIAAASQKMSKINLKGISSCLLVVLCCFLLSIPSAVYIAFRFAQQSSKDNVALSYVWAGTVYAMNSTFNSLIFFWKNKLLRTEAMKILSTLAYSFLCS